MAANLTATEPATPGKPTTRRDTHSCCCSCCCAAARPRPAGA